MYTYPLAAVGIVGFLFTLHIPFLLGLPGFWAMLEAADSGYRLVGEEAFVSDVKEAQDKLWIFERVVGGESET